MANMYILSFVALISKIISIFYYRYYLGVGLKNYFDRFSAISGLKNMKPTWQHGL